MEENKFSAEIFSLSNWSMPDISPMIKKEMWQWKPHFAFFKLCEHVTEWLKML